MRLYQRRNSVSKLAILCISVCVRVTHIHVYVRESTRVAVCPCTVWCLCLWRPEADVVSLIVFLIMYEAGSLAGAQSSLLWFVRLADLLQGALPLPTMHLGCPDHHTCATHYLDASDPNSGPHTVTSALPHTTIFPVLEETQFKKKLFKFLWCNFKIYISTMSERAVI